MYDKKFYFVINKRQLAFPITNQNFIGLSTFNNLCLRLGQITLNKGKKKRKTTFFNIFFHSCFLSFAIWWLFSFWLHIFIDDLGTIEMSQTEIEELNIYSKLLSLICNGFLITVTLLFPQRVTHSHGEVRFLLLLHSKNDTEKMLVGKR